ncbi:MAG: 5'-nucleotidase C-terminal domain-containing protein, partial [Clostridia bacterium]|nr:5'-nucleotidase C-terminal domain-containing protein [Clostridia bacterium]
AIEAEVDAQYGAVFAKSEVELNGAKAPNGNRDSQTNNGNLITEAMLWSVLKEGALEVPTENVVCITNGGGIRAAINVGDVSMNDVKTVMPFGNTVAVIYVTGAELLEVLEASTYCTPEAVGGFPQTSGIQWTLDTTKAYDQGEIYMLDGKEGSYYAPASIQRVSIQSINGEPFDENAIYAVVTNNFCAAGGDTYNAFARAYNEGSGFDTGIPMDEAVMAFITDVLNGVIPAETYGAPQGRMTIIQ